MFRFATSILPGVLLAVVTTDVAAQTRVPNAASSTAHASMRQALASTIRGNALSPIDTGLAFAPIRLRDVRFGRVAGSTSTDRGGAFLFQDVEPGSYVVELLDPEHATLAASQILYVNAGDTVSTVVKVPYHASQFARVIGYTKTSALTVLSAAAASGVLAAVVTGQPVSPGQ